MNKNLKSIFQKLFYYLQYSKSYSQDGEDMILKALFESKKGYKGFFVDVGAHHPVRFSNTKYFYDRGWKGINIEPTPNAIKAFKLFRKRDINLNIGIGTTEGSLTFYCFNEPALNSFSKEVSEKIHQSGGKYRIIKEEKIEVLPLSKVFDKYLPKGQTIDFISIDVEGLDYNVLLSNDWEKYQPQIILVEENVNVDELGNSPIYQFLKSKGYSFFAKTLRTCIYKK
ncbi:FkbM family methyltransferase [Nubsella zeaxanthinifaciens]|uniref:FkbM family methyltransferase n=1 Tax=Nubsella zeaxanthinifaciens TaxID=392412 RepID=UPI0018E57A89|nr:FkbM family methyltransferase [Nubsella zeaxanthinifaciens]